MPESISRREYLKHFRSVRAWAVLDRATNEQMRVTYDPCTIEQDSLNGKQIATSGKENPLKLARMQSVIP